MNAWADKYNSSNANCINSTTPNNSDKSTTICSNTITTNSISGTTTSTSTRTTKTTAIIATATSTSGCFCSYKYATINTKYLCKFFPTTSTSFIVVFINTISISNKKKFFLKVKKNSESYFNNKKVLDKWALQELVKEIDPSQQLDEDVEDVIYLK